MPGLHLSRLIFVVIGLATLTAPVWSHSELLLQIENLDAQLLAEPENVDLLVERGDLYRRHEDYVSAAQDFTTARALQPDYPLLDFYEGWLLLNRGDPAGAELRLDRYLANHPQHASAWILQAETQLALDHPEQAAADYARAIQNADQPSPALYRDWSLALVAAGELHWNAARRAVDIGLERFPQDVSLLGLGTDIALAENRPLEADRYIDYLPPALSRLPRWQSRIELRQCLAPETLNENVAACQSAAANAVREQMPH